MAKRAFTEGNWKKDPWFKNLCKALSNKSETEIASFLRDVGTLSELQAWSERFEVAKQIKAGKSYRDISKDTGASTTTVTRVAKFLSDGEGGYENALTATKSAPKTKASPKAQHHHHQPDTPAKGGRRRRWWF